jgi:hypothetical protein
MRPTEQVVLQTPPAVVAADLQPDGRKVQVILDAVTDQWIRQFEEGFKAYAKANTVELFEKELDPEFIDESFRSCLPPQGTGAPLSVTLTDDACVFEHTREMVDRTAVRAGTYVNLLLEIVCIQFGKHWFTPKLRAVSVRIVPPPPAPKPTPTYESLGWVDDDLTETVQQQALPASAQVDELDDDQLSIDIDLDGVAPPTVEVDNAHFTAA